MVVPISLPSKLVAESITEGNDAAFRFVHSRDKLVGKTELKVFLSAAMSQHLDGCGVADVTFSSHTSPKPIAGGTLFAIYFECSHGKFNHVLTCKVSFHRKDFKQLIIISQY